MKNEEIHAVEMTRKIRDEMYEETKDLSTEELIRYFREKSQKLQARDGKGILFLKTVIPSPKATCDFLSKDEPDV